LSGNGIAGTNGGGTADDDGELDGELEGSARCDDEPHPTSRASIDIDAINWRNFEVLCTPAR
jgi:hypothetical protein